MTEVVAALFWENGRFYICRRPAHKARGLLWEFVGGKIEPGERGEEALKRECREELAAEIEVGPVFTSLVHKYPDITIRLTLHYASLKSEVTLLEHCEAKWITPEEIPNYDFCPADADILEMLKKLTPELCAVREKLFSLAEPGYKAFSAKLIPTIAPEKILGVRVPQLRKLAKELSREEKAALLSSLPHTYQEENLLHGFVAGTEKDFSSAVRLTEEFLPHIDNWAVCDIFSPNCFKKHKKELLPYLKKWIKSKKPYTCRFAVEMLMAHYLDEDFSPAYPELVSKVKSEEYYVNMMCAWYFATALAKQYDAVLPYLTEGRLPAWVHNKTIQKAVESFRITDAQKTFLKTLKK